MKTKAVFYHAGCPVCVEAEQALAHSLDPSRYSLEVIHLGQEKGKIGEAEKAGVRSVPALVIGNHPFHINFGAKLSDLR